MVTYKVQLVTADGSMYSLRVEKDQLILDAALESDFNLPYTCYQPWSLTCNYETISFNNKKSKASDIGKGNLRDSYQSGQDLLDKLLNEETKKRTLRNLKSQKEARIFN